MMTEIEERVLNQIRKKIEKPTFKSKIEVAKTAMDALLKELKQPTYDKKKPQTKKIGCCNCRKPVEVVLKDYNQKTLKSWASICMGCLDLERSNYEEKIKELLLDIQGYQLAQKEEESWLLGFFKKEIAYSVPVWITEEMKLRLSKLKGEKKNG